MSPEPLFHRPTSVFVAGTNRPLLNWVAYALALDANPEFRWTDVRISGELFDKTDILARAVIPPSQLNFRYPNELRRNEPGSMPTGSRTEPSASAGAGAGGGSGLGDFLQLPGPTRELLASLPSGERPIPLVLSNAHRILALWPAEVMSSVLRVITSYRVILFLTFADAPPDGRRAFETVVHLSGDSPTAWEQATLRIEKSPPDGPFKAGAQLSLRDIPPIADVLRRAF